MIKESAPGQQIPLAFNKYDQIDFELFEVGRNQAVVKYLNNLLKEKFDNQIAYLWGAPGSGKSHLLQAACTAAARDKLTVAYIPLKEASELSPAMLEGLESLALICLDDIDKIAGKTDWEEAIFHLYNRLRDANIPLLISSNCSPLASEVLLPDLKSRLAWGQVFHLLPLNESEALNSLMRRAHSRGFDLPNEVAGYLIKRVSRDMHSLFGVLDKLDRASLVAKKKLSIPFVRELLD
ncbi:MAG: DnaA regulatory inactivator Hda [Gammaproteobacteria bacterium]|nr:DnaA regulatory inactivator Hda [Gammaproteobacteria bacterium]